MSSHQFEASALLPVIGRIYDAALDVRVWPEVIGKIASLHASHRAYLFTTHPPAEGGVFFSVGIPETALQQYAVKYREHDVWLNATQEKGYFVEGSIVTDEDLCPHEKFLESVFYRDFLSRLGIARLCSGVVFGADSTGMPTTGCSVFRGLNDASFGERERAIHSTLIPHISRALGIMFRLRDSELRAASTLAGFDRLASGVLLLGSLGEVTFANRAAQRMLQARDGLRLRANGHGRAHLVAHDPHDQSALSAAIHQSIAPDIIDVSHFLKAVSVRRPSALPAYALNFSALPEHNEFGSGADRPRAIAFLTDPAQPVRVDADLLKRLYGLTQAECRLAELLCAGDTLAAVATKLNVREATVKTQLQSIFEKTQTRRQVQLVKLLVSLASFDAT